MLTVIRTIIAVIALFEVILMFLTVSIFPENRIIRCLRKHKTLQIAFGIILALGYLSAILSRCGF